MKKLYYILREMDTDNFIQHKGEDNTLTTNTRNIAVFKESSLEERLSHAKRVSNILQKKIVSEDWGNRE